MRRLIINLVLCLMAFVTISSCYRAKPSAGEEAVLIYKPMFFGEEGVEKTPVTTGSEWCWFTTDDIYVSMVPHKFDEKIDDAASNDNTPLDFNTSITLKIEDGKSPILIENYGTNWYKNVIRETYINTAINYISRYNPFDLISNREVADSINGFIKTDMEEYIIKLSKDKPLPIKVVNVIIGKAYPNKLQKDEMERTAAAIQAKQTQERKREMEEVRESAERQRAIADKAYQKELGLTTDQFIQLRAWEIISQKNGANIDVMFNADGTNKMWNIRR